jgi:hypothetical protein
MWCVKTFSRRKTKPGLFCYLNEVFGKCKFNDSSELRILIMKCQCVAVYESHYLL